MVFAPKIGSWLLHHPAPLIPRPLLRQRPRTGKGATQQTVQQQEMQNFRQGETSNEQCHAIQVINRSTISWTMQM
jgi:hypothetical protein